MTVDRIDLRETKGKYHYDAEDDPQLLATLSVFTDIFNTVKAGEKVYIEFLDGDRKGSIAEFQPNPKYREWDTPKVRTNRKFYSTDKTTYEADCTLYGQLKFTGKSHRPEEHLRPGCHVVWLKGYEGPTVWKKFDAKSAKEELLADHGQVDRDGVPLAVGDKVIYVNLAYGSGAEIARGTIKEFKASVDSQRHTIYTIVENKIDGSEMKTDKPHQLFLKMENAVWK